MVGEGWGVPKDPLKVRAPAQQRDNSNEREKHCGREKGSSARSAAEVRGGAARRGPARPGRVEGGVVEIWCGWLEPPALRRNCESLSAFSSKPTGIFSRRYQHPHGPTPCHAVLGWT